jgi:hypothetical protein
MKKLNKSIHLIYGIFVHSALLGVYIALFSPPFTPSCPPPHRWYTMYIE